MSSSEPDSGSEAAVFKRLLGHILTLFAWVGGAFTVGGAINTAVGAHWTVRYSGARITLPTEWAVVVILALVFGVSLVVGQWLTRDPRAASPAR